MQKLQQSGGQESISELKAAFKTKSYPLARGYLKTATFAEKVKTGSRYPDFSPLPTAVFSMNMEAVYSLTDARSHIFIDPEIADPDYPTLAVFAAGRAVRSAEEAEIFANMNGIMQPTETTEESGQDQPAKVDMSASVSPYCLFSGTRLVGCAVHLEFLGGTAFGSAFLANVSTPDAPGAGGQSTWTEEEQGIDDGENAKSRTAASLQMMKDATHGAAKNTNILTLIASPLSKERLQHNGMFSAGDFASGVRTWVPPGRDMVMKDAKSIFTGSRRYIQGAVTCDAIRTGGETFTRNPSMRVRIFRWFEGLPREHYLKYIPTEIAVPSFITREYLEMVHRNMPGIFQITPRNLDEEYAKYKSSLGLGTVIT